MPVHFLSLTKLENVRKPLERSQCIQLSILSWKEKSKTHDSSKGERNRRERGRNTFKGMEIDTTKVIDPIFLVLITKRMGHVK
jgi:hypothetical protein